VSVARESYGEEAADYGDAAFNSGRYDGTEYQGYVVRLAGDF